MIMNTLLSAIPHHLSNQPYFMVKKTFCFHITFRVHGTDRVLIYRRRDKSGFLMIFDDNFAYFFIKTYVMGVH